MLTSCWRSERDPKMVNKEKDDAFGEGGRVTIREILEDVVASLEDNGESSSSQKSPTAAFHCVSKITEDLLLSSATAANSAYLKYFRVTCVVNAAIELPDPPLGNATKYYKIPIFDDPTADILSHLDNTSDAINKEISKGGRVLVHCIAGVSRSPTICIAYMMKYHGMTLSEAYEHVKSKRPVIRPNKGFFKQLIAYEKSLHGTATVSMVFNETVKMEIPDVYDCDYRDITSFRRKRRDMVRRH